MTEVYLRENEIKKEIKVEPESDSTSTDSTSTDSTNWGSIGQVRKNDRNARRKRTKQIRILYEREGKPFLPLKEYHALRKQQAIDNKIKEFQTLPLGQKLKLISNSYCKDCLAQGCQPNCNNDCAKIPIDKLFPPMINEIIKALEPSQPVKVKEEPL